MSNGRPVFRELRIGMLANHFRDAFALGGLFDSLLDGAGVCCVTLQTGIEVGFAVECNISNVKDGTVLEVDDSVAIQK